MRRDPNSHRPFLGLGADPDLSWSSGRYRDKAPPRGAFVVQWQVCTDMDLSICPRVSGPVLHRQRQHPLVLAKLAHQLRHTDVMAQ